MKIKIVYVSDSDKHFTDAIWEYQKRLWKSVTLVPIKPVKYGTQNQIREKETEVIRTRIQKLAKSDKKILLSLEWDDISTEKFSSLIWHWSVVLIIWWPYGLIESRLEWLIDKKISFWKQTMPHGLVKLVLLEQIYRSGTLLSGKKYHY